MDESFCYCCFTVDTKLKNDKPLSIIRKTIAKPAVINQSEIVRN